MISAKSDSEVTQGLMEQWSSGDGGYRVSLYCKAKELQTCHNSLYTGALLGYNKETIIEGIEGQEGEKVKTCQWLCHLRVSDVIKWKRKERKEKMCRDRLWEVLWLSIITGPSFQESCSSWFCKWSPQWSSWPKTCLDDAMHRCPVELTPMNRGSWSGPSLA